MKRFNLKLVFSLVIIFLIVPMTAAADSRPEVEVLVDEFRGQEFVVEELNQLSRLNIIRSSEIEGTAKVEEKAAQLGADFFIKGLFVSVGEANYRFELEVFDLTAEKVVYSRKFVRQKKEVIDIFRKEIIAELEKIMLAYNLSGQIVDNQGRPIGGVRIKFNQDYSSVFSDPDGKWEQEGIFGSVVVEPEKEGWEFAPEKREVGRGTKEVIFRGRKLPSLAKVEIDLEATTLHLGSEYQVQVWGFDQYGNFYEINPSWEVKGTAFEIKPITDKEDLIVLQPVKEGSSVLEFKAEGRKKRFNLEVASGSIRAAKVKESSEQPKIKLKEESSNPWDVGAGISYNTYLLDQTNETVEEQGGSSKNSGIGWHLKIKSDWKQLDFVDDGRPSFLKDWVLGFEIERMVLNYDLERSNTKLELSNTGFLVSGSYPFAEELLADEVISFNLAVGPYLAVENYVLKEGDWALGPGLKTGVDFKLPLKNDYYLRGGTNYRLAGPGAYNFSGLEFFVTGEVVF